MAVSRPPATLLTGATGFLGGLVAAKLLTDSDCRLILPIRTHHDTHAIWNRIVAEALVTGASPSRLADRVAVLPLPASHDIRILSQACRDQGVTSIVHCAGCVDYFDTKALNAGNIDLTGAVVKLAQDLHAKRLTFVSSAFSSGYRSEPIPESLHFGASDDPTEYTRSKREAEALVAASGINYLIVRPSIVVGDSRDGRYGGKRYGIYQLWAAAEKIMCTQYHSRIYAIAPRVKLPLIHQDAFQDGFMAAYRSLPPNSVVHLVSRPESLPTVRDVWDLWLMTCSRPREAFYFDRLEDVPMEKLSRQQQLWVELTAVNLDISCRPWSFAADTLDQLRNAGLDFADVTLETIEVCQHRFIADSPRVRAFMENHKTEREIEPNLIECGSIS